MAARLVPLDRGTTMAKLADESVAGMVGDDPDPAGVALARAVIASTPPSAFRDSTRSMIGFDLREAMDRIALPVFLVAGSKDGLQGHERARAHHGQDGGPHSGLRLCLPRKVQHHLLREMA